jgi:hypothetical protein
MVQQILFREHGVRQRRNLGLMLCWLHAALSSPLQGAPKLKVAIVGSGLAGLSTAVELLDQVGAGRGGAGLSCAAKGQAMPGE